jgi:hypothetical protein
MAARVRGEVTGRKMTTATVVAVDTSEEADAYSVEEFCRRHRISVQLFYKLRPQMPATFNVGNRRLISREAAAAWRREREQAADAVA